MLKLPPASPHSLHPGAGASSGEPPGRFGLWLIGDQSHLESNELAFANLFKGSHKEIITKSPKSLKW